jgi:hypothetical protein
MLAQQENDGQQYPQGLTCKTFPNLVLNKSCPWKKLDLGRNSGWITEYIKFPAAPVWDIHLSAPVNILFLDHGLTKDVRKTVELAVGAGYHCGYHHYYMIGIEYLELLAASQHLLIEYHKIAVDKFDGVASGNPTSGCINPTAVQFEDMFLDSDGNPTSMIDNVVMDIICLLNWVSATISTNNWNHCNIEQEFKNVVAICQE